MKYKFILALTATLGICATSAFAVPHFWVDATGSWFNAANWSPPSVPTAGDSATIGANGFATTGTANINGALAQANNLFLGLDAGTSGTVHVFNGGELLLNGGAGNAFIGEAGTGLLTVTQGSFFIANNITAGDLTGSSGELDVRTIGVGIANNNTTIGNNGTGRMEITGGGVVNTLNNAFIGRAAGGVGTVLVDGGAQPFAITPSYWLVVNNLDVGEAGTGTLNIVDGGLVQVVNNTNIGNLAGSNGLVVVRGFNSFRTSELDAFGNLRVGDAGNGELDIRGGGFVDVPTGNVFVGDAATGVGLVKVDGLTATTGNPSEFTINLGNLTVGNFGMGTIHITNGGLVDPFDAFIGRNVGSTGLVTVDGSNAFGSSSFRVAHNLFIGGNAGGPGGKGELDITNGGSVFVGNDMVVWGAPTNNRPSNGKLAIDHTYNLAVGGTSFFEGGTLQFLDNQVDFGPPHTVGGPGYVSGNPVVLGTLTGPVGMFVDTNNGTMPLFNIVGPGQSGFPRISELLTGPGGLTVFGGGDVFLTNNNTFTGLTNVSDNSFLFIDGSVAGDARVDVGSFLGGRFGGMAPVANVGGNLTVNGTLSPGDIIAHGAAAPLGDPETFVVFGNARFNPTSTYVAEVGNVDIGAIPQPGSDLLITGGTTTIDPVGSTIIVPRLDNFQPAPTEFLGGPPNGLAGEASETTVILTGGGRFNQFSTLIAENWPGLIQPVQDTDEPFVLEIKYVLSPFTSVPGLCDNEFRVAEALDTAVAELPIRAITFLGFIPIADLPHAFELIAPEEYASMYEMSFSHAIVQSDNLQRHMDDIHAGATGYCGPVVEVNPPPIQDKNVADKKEVAPAFVPAPENRWSIWVQGNGDFVDVKNGDECAHGYNIDNGSITVGMDYRVLPNLAVGVYGGYLGSNADLVNRGSINMAQGNVGGYATFSWNGFYIDASGGGGWSNYNTHRFALEANDPVLGLDFGPFANGQTDGSEVDAMGAIGYDWHWDTGTKLGCLNVGPLVSIQYTDVSLDGFRERGSLLPLIFPDQDEDSVRLTAGGRASLDIKVNNGILLRPEVRCSWLHEFSDQEYPILARFLPTTPLFRADGPSVGSDGALLGAGMTVQFSPSFGIFAFYDGVFGRTNYDLNSASGGFRISF